MKLSTIALAAAMFAAPAMMVAQAPTAGHRVQNMHQRSVNQQRRIRQGVRSGALTHRESLHLERQERGIRREVRGMRAQDNGRLTRADRRVIHRQLNQESRRINRDIRNRRVG